MKLGIMQPYFFPYLGHFALIAAVDEWIVFDVTQYTPKTWMNRNRILHPKEGWQYVTVPLANSSINIKTHEARVLDVAAARNSVLGKLSAFRRQAPHYAQVKRLVEDAFARVRTDSLSELNTHTLATVCEYLGVPFRHRVCSQLGLEFPADMAPGQWAPFVCAALGAAAYVNPAGGRQLFDPADFTRVGVELQFAEFDEFRYDAAPWRYEPNLSILDVLLWNDARRVADVLCSHGRLCTA